MFLHKVRVDDAGNMFVKVVCGTAEVVPLGDCFRLSVVTDLCQAVMLPRRYYDLEVARHDRDLLNAEEHPVSIPERFSTIGSSVA